MTATNSELLPAPVEPAMLDLLLEEHLAQTLPRLERLWDYYRNAMRPALGSGQAQGASTGRWYTLAQEQGLPARFTAPPMLGASARGGGREVVIENDIAWRIHALVDFMFGKPVALQSCAPDPQRATLLETFLRQVLEGNGGVAFLQDLALLGSVYGYVDVLVRCDERRAAESASPAEGFVLELVEPPRAVPLLNPDDYRRLDAYVLHYRQLLNQVEIDGFLSRMRKRVIGSVEPTSRRLMVECTEVWSDQAVLKYRGTGENRELVEASVNRLGRIPVVHIQNLAQPFFYEGLSEVEPLVPLQDELNIRLSDRANRVTFQSFKMYLGKGLEGFLDRPVGPGQMWATDNEQASIEEFGGDTDSPSEESHIREIREAMDKTSAVSGVAAGLIGGKVGNLTSENALRVTLMGLLAKTEKKRITYGTGIQRVCEMLLHAADVLGVLPNTPQERRIRLDWPSPMPEDTAQRLREAQLKLAIGVPRKQVLTEMGYGECAEA